MKATIKLECICCGEEYELEYEYNPHVATGFINGLCPKCKAAIMHIRSEIETAKYSRDPGLKGEIK